MIKQCMKCEKIGLWFEFFKSFEGLYTWAPNYCKECAHELTTEAVRKDIEKIKSPPLPL